jgi:hypothetical protein
MRHMRATPQIQHLDVIRKLAQMADEAQFLVEACNAIGRSGPQRAIYGKLTQWEGRVMRHHFKSVIILLAALQFAAVGSALPGDTILKIDNPSPGLLDQFGFEVAATKKDLAIGSPNDSNTSQVGGGAVYLYDAKTLAFRTAQNGQGNDTFTSYGAALAIGGSNLVIGEPQADPNLIVDAGYAYLYDLKRLQYIRTFSNPQITAGDFFGKDVAASKNLFAIGAPGDDTVTTNAGTTYLFDRGTSSVRRILFPASQSQNQEFGSAIAFLGKNVAVGAPGQISPAGANSGIVHLYDSTDGGFLGLLFEENRPAGSRFGAALAGSKKLLAVGSPGSSGVGAVYLFTLGNSSIGQPIGNPAGASGDDFGISLAIVGKKFLLVGAPGNDFGGLDAGAAYVFDLKTRALVLTVHNPESTPGDRFGQSVASDGKRLFIGCPGNVVSGLPGAGSVFVIEGPQ